MDLSYNEIGRQAFNSLLHRLRLNDSVTHINVAYNEFLTGEKLISLVEFLSLNKTCTNLNVAGCILNGTDLMFLG